MEYSNRRACTRVRPHERDVEEGSADSAGCGTTVTYEDSQFAYQTMAGPGVPDWLSLALTLGAKIGAYHID